jgi:hypothetical protein
MILLIRENVGGKKKKRLETASLLALFYGRSDSRSEGLILRYYQIGEEMEDTTSCDVVRSAQ